MNIELLKKCGTVVIYQRDQAVCREGEAGRSMFILLRGNAEVVINSFSNQAEAVAWLKEGSFFGEMSLLEKKPRTATIVVRSDEAMVLEIGEDRFSYLLEQAPDIAYSLLCTLNNRLNDMLERLWEKDRKFVFQYKKGELYATIQKLDEEIFTEICEKKTAYAVEVLRYLSSSLEGLNQKYAKPQE